MITLLRKIFIKNYINIEDEKVRSDHGLLGSVFGAFCNLILFVIKLIIGILSNSISIIGDAINNLTDIGSSIISFFGFKLSLKPADKDHPYGHQRMEYITSLIISIIIIVVGIELLSSSITKVISNEEAVYSSLTFCILAISILIKLYLAYFNHKLGKQINSLTLIATAKDSLNDVISTVVILISATVSVIFNWNIDGYMGILVACFIIISGIKLVKETIDPLLGEKVDKNLIKKIVEEIKSSKEVLGIHDLMCHSYGPSKIFMSIHIEFDCTKNILYIHDIVDTIESTIKNKYNVELVIHMDPVDLNCNITSYYKQEVERIISSISTQLSFHDFRTVITEFSTNLLFDIVVPINFKMTNNEIEELIKGEFIDSEVSIRLIIAFDSDFNT